MTRRLAPIQLTLALALAALALAACTGPGASTGPTATLAGFASAGPTCPVVTDPPDPACVDRPVAGAVLIVRTADGGREVARTTTGTDGSFSLDLSPGAYRLEPQPVEGLMGTAAPVDVTLGESGIRDLVLSYDTGIR